MTECAGPLKAGRSAKWMRWLSVRLPGRSPVHRQLKILLGDVAVYCATQSLAASGADLDPGPCHCLDLLSGIRVRKREVLVPVDEIVRFATRMREEWTS